MRQRDIGYEGPGTSLRQEVGMLGVNEISENVPGCMS